MNAKEYYVITKNLVITHRDTSNLVKLKPDLVLKCNEQIARLEGINEKLRHYHFKSLI